MELDRLERDVKRLREKTAELTNPGFTYYEQELIRRIIKSVLPQIKNSTDITVAQDILKKTEWLDNG
jgi:Ribonuclease G/E